MIYAYEIKETPEGFIGYVYDLELETLPQPSAEEVASLLPQVVAGFIELQYRRKHKSIPLPQAQPINGRALYVPIKLQLKILLWNTMQEKKIKQVELGEKLGESKAMIQQYFNGGNVSVEKYERALQALGKYCNVMSIDD